MLKMLARLTQTSFATHGIARTIPKVFSTCSTVNGVQSGDKFFLRHQLESKHVSGSKWKLYRVASVGLLGGLAACFICPGNALVDFATVTLLVHHNYAGLNAVIADYCPLFFSDGITTAVKNLWFVISVITLALLYGFNYRDVGFSKTLVALFKL